MKKQPNVVVFFTDQQRWDSMGLHGNPLELTPNLDRMARRGTFLKNAFTCQPVCGPARSCMQTGQHATNTGCYRNRIPLKDDAQTLAHYFNAAGYHTGYIGKWHLAVEEPVTEPNRGGYQWWLAANMGSEPQPPEFRRGVNHPALFNGDNELVKMPGYRVDAYTDAAIGYVNEHKDEPFFLFVSHNEPHHINRIDAYPAPEGYEERYRSRWTPPDLAALNGTTHQQLAGYWGMCKRIDESLGRLMDALKSVDILDNTIILFASDHGCHFKTRNSEYKRSCHESSIRIPAAISGPGFEAGGELEQLVSLVDFPATLLDAAGIEVPDHMEGASLLPIAQKKSNEWRDDMFVQISESQVGRAIRTQRWKYSIVAPGIGGNKQPGSDHYVEECLYDLWHDPYELANLIGMESHQGVCKRMRERLIARMVQAGETAPTIEPAELRKSAPYSVVPGEEED